MRATCAGSASVQMIEERIRINRMVIRDSVARAAAGRGCSQGIGSLATMPGVSPSIHGAKPDEMAEQLHGSGAQEVSCRGLLFLRGSVRQVRVRSEPRRISIILGRGLDGP